MELSGSEDMVSSAESDGCNTSKSSRRTTTTTKSRSSKGGSAGNMNKVKNKLKKKKEKTAEELTIQNCDRCGVLSDTFDPLREHERKAKPDLPQTTYRWGRGEAPNTGRVKKGSCYYCKRTHRAKKQYSAMKPRELDELDGG